ncbi:MAG: hypothetical protein OEM15_02950 [Myxococcales bacterium]|nr:hypothetical protein [Myxococcales bacterium]MDH3483992.1 hypothetical protein [Myxococcales bacterium]
MEELFKDWIGAIAVLVYLLYPLLKRWLDRRKKTEPRSAPREPAEASAPQRKPRAPSRPEPPFRTPPSPPARPATAPHAPEGDIIATTQARAMRLREQATALLRRAEGDPRLIRLVRALRDDLLDRLAAIDRSLAGKPTVSTVMQEATVIQGLQQLLRYLDRMAEQRLRGSASILGDADAMADACYAPLLELASAHGLGLRTSTPVVVSGDWALSIVPRFASTRVAPLRIPRGFGRSLWLWPAIAHEIAHDLYYSVDGLEADLHDRLGLPQRLSAPSSEREIDPGWLRQLFGAWLAEVFADTMGTLMLGPAYVETMRRAFRDPDSAHRTSAIFAGDGWIDEHPPARLRLYMASRVLHHLGRHQEGDSLWARWEAEHGEVGLYYLPLAGRWVGLSDESLHALADSIVDTLLGQSWPELADFQLMNIPGFAYLHAEHAETQRLRAQLARGETVHADVRWIMAAAVLAAAEQPALHDPILAAARLSIIGIGTEERRAQEPKAVRPPTGAIGDTLVASLRQPGAIREAIILGEAIRPYHAPRWR